MHAANGNKALLLYYTTYLPEPQMTEDDTPLRMTVRCGCSGINF